MIKKFSNNYAIFSIFLDAVIVVGALRLAQILRPRLVEISDLIRDFHSVPAPSLFLSVLFASIWLIVFIRFELYNPEKNLRSEDELSNHILASITAATITAGMLYLTQRELSRVLFLTFGLLATVLTYAHRLLYRVFAREGLLNNSTRQGILIVGAGLVGRSLAEAIKNYQPLGFNIIGFIDDDHDLIESDSNVLGDIDQTVEIIQKHQVENVVISLPRRAYERTNALISQVHKLAVRVWVIPDYFALSLNQASVLDFAGFPMINLRAPVLNNYQRITKRIFDLTITIPLFLLFLPLMALISLAIKLDSPGPVFYFSPRLMENGELFKMIKFRTMVEEADRKLKDVIIKDEDGNLIHKRKDDPRVTKVGKFLRKTSLDELPQLIHVIRGDMSLVGPRPELPIMVDRYENWQRSRFGVPQGITGWWQVNGRSDKPMHLHTEEDLYYIQHYSFWMDIKILLKTIWIVLRGRGAY